MGAISVEKVNGEVMISSPGWRRRRSMASRSADDPELTITPWLLASRSETRISRLRTSFPRSRVGFSFRTLMTASISRSSWDAPAGGRSTALSSSERGTGVVRNSSERFLKFSERWPVFGRYRGEVVEVHAVDVGGVSSEDRP